ncbi:prepilin-type N-terminal cleavage/methylation domain-containing protein [Motilimonas sp. KMU-193]|uniref:prepilin-type N-terminal cleavage/methylation domain-containing protein n=1 Tax=Motilimonas sp. KMU-193 TaxID=3388668 RepID=UPI00396B450C
MARSRRANLTTQCTGFTLVELVIVIIIIGVLAAFVLPKLLSSGGYQDYTVRDQLATRLRLTQLKNMNADPNDVSVNACYWTVVQVSASEACFYSIESARVSGNCAPPTSVSCDPNAPEHGSDVYDLVAFSPKVAISPATFLFDYNGIEQVACGGSFPCDISINSGNNLTLRIEAEGYIHAP